MVTLHVSPVFRMLVSMIFICRLWIFQYVSNHGLQAYLVAINTADACAVGIVHNKSLRQVARLIRSAPAGEVFASELMD